jgi:ABC-type transport system substrate-binding protein
MTRNDDYWGRRWRSRIVLKKVGEDADAASLLAGQGDVINNLPVDDLARVEKHPHVRVEKVEGLRMYFLACICPNADNKLVRPGD